MRLFLFALILALMMIAVAARPRTSEAISPKKARAHSDKSKMKTHPNHKQPGKHANPNADLLFLDQLIL
ncbi:hypothetical protein GCK32_001107 [Trichostrongylus colubriformis]|uniref:Uncharacterized protein n=1 Tax=Trichostrongylus colubriformis TaxID=6319 RepID=A0AAN8F1I5_TRICO